jgi:hypothetical protein
VAPQPMVGLLIPARSLNNEVLYTAWSQSVHLHKSGFGHKPEAAAASGGSNELARRVYGAPYVQQPSAVRRYAPTYLAGPTHCHTPLY